MPRAFHAMRGNLFSRPDGRHYPFENIKESLADYGCRAYSDNRRCDSYDGCGGLPAAASTWVSQGNGQIVSTLLDIFIVVHAHKPAFGTNVFGGEVAAG
jgi:hypothetical protein